MVPFRTLNRDRVQLSKTTQSHNCNDVSTCQHGTLSLLLRSKEYELSFEQQFHYGVFYAWVKLREQETRNLEYLGISSLVHGCVCVCGWVEGEGLLVAVHDSSAMVHFQLYTGKAGLKTCQKRTIASP